MCYFCGCDDRLTTKAELDEANAEIARHHELFNTANELLSVLFDPTLSSPSKADNTNSLADEIGEELFLELRAFWDKIR